MHADRDEARPALGWHADGSTHTHPFEVALRVSSPAQDHEDHPRGIRCTRPACLNDSFRRQNYRSPMVNSSPSDRAGCRLL